MLLVAAAATAAGVLLISGQDDGGNGQPRAGSAAPSPPAGPSRAAPQSRSGGHRGHDQSTRRQVHRAVEESTPATLGPSQRLVARVVRRYVAALSARNGKRACSLFVPGALGKVEFPRDRGGCARSLSASIGYRDPRGFPVYESSRVARVSAVALEGSLARVTATTVTRFAGNREPSVEDDVVYLRQRNGRWLIAKPSTSLYRAIGVGDIPPQVLAPP